MMQITGSYSNYLTMTNLLAPLGVGNAGQIVMHVFSSAIDNLRGRLDQQIFSQESEFALKGLYENISELSDRAKVLTLNDPDSVFYDRSALSSDSSILEASAVNAFSANSGASLSGYDITVIQLAQAQQNVGFELNGEDLSAIDPGWNTFDLNIDGAEHIIGVEISEEDTNEDALQKIAQAINNAGIGISADIVDGITTGIKQMVITAQNSGAGNTFVINDISGNANAITGMNNLQTIGQDALYRVDGNDYSSNQNSVYLDDGLVAVYLKSAGQATLRIAPDEAKAAEAITSLVSEFNAFLDFLEDNAEYIEDKLGSSLTTFISNQQSTLATFGITPDENGRLNMDETQLGAALNRDMGAVKELFAGFDGLAVQIQNLSSRVITASPLEYAKEAQKMDVKFTDYLYSSSAEMLQGIVRGTLLNSYV
ncbi:MAG: flagellar filament capping protein FliD [Deltaproteobacteria bacterium]|nr:flagellar filament capping protein FliD [Deltaproteobacteria bacterium]